MTRKRFVFCHTPGCTTKMDSHKASHFCRNCQRARAEAAAQRKRPNIRVVRIPVTGTSAVPQYAYTSLPEEPWLREQDESR